MKSCGYKNCGRPAEYKLEYVDRFNLENNNAKILLDQKDYSCKEHITKLDGFLYDPLFGLPLKVIEIQNSNVRPDLLKKITQAYEIWWNSFK